MNISRTTLESHSSEPDFDLVYLRMRNYDDKNAFKQLFDAFYSPLCVFCKKYDIDHATIEDIVQEVFIKLWENRSCLNIDKSIRNYLITMAKNRCMNLLTSLHVKNSILSSLEKRENDNPESEAEELLTVNELMAMLQKVLAKMPEPYRVAFQMGTIEKQKTAEIAQKLHVSTRTAERYRKKALQILRIGLKEYYPLILVLLDVN